MTYGFSEVPYNPSRGRNHSVALPMKNSVLRQTRQSFQFVSFLYTTSSPRAHGNSTPHFRTMAITYAAAISTPNGGVRQPQIQARACSDPDMRASFEAAQMKQEEKKPQRPGAGIRAKTSFRGWATKKESKSNLEVQRNQPYVVEESRPSGHFARSEHKPNTKSDEEHVYVLTLKVTDSLAKPMDAMRDRYFPRHLNRTGAHLTLFHALPHSQVEVLEGGLGKVAASMKPFGVSSGKPFRMRKGVGINVDEGYKAMKDLHADLQSQWATFLSEQDAGGLRPHWTVMNKVDDESKVDGAFATIRQELSESNQEGTAVGLDLWRYERGNWIFAKEYMFGDVVRSPTRVDTPGSADDRSLQLSPSADQSTAGGPVRRPSMFKRGSSVGDALRSMSFRKRG